MKKPTRPEKAAAKSKSKTKAVKKFPTNPEAVTAHISTLPKEVQARMKQIRAALKKAAPGAGEDIKWSMPSISYHRILVNYGAFKNHIGLYPTPSALQHFAKDIAKYKHAAGSIQFPHDKPLPLPLITKIVKFRVKESLEEDRKWKEN